MSTHSHHGQLWQPPLPAARSLQPAPRAVHLPARSMGELWGRVWVHFLAARSHSRSSLPHVLATRAPSAATSMMLPGWRARLKRCWWLRQSHTWAGLAGRVGRSAAVPGPAGVFVGQIAHMNSAAAEAGVLDGSMCLQWLNLLVPRCC